jgi:hypothetical protein
MNKPGFYKNEEHALELLYAPNFVYAGSFNLLKEEKDTYTYPTGGWYWFDSIEEAYAFWKLPLPQWYLKELEGLNNA